MCSSNSMPEMAPVGLTEAIYSARQQSQHQHLCDCHCRRLLCLIEMMSHRTARTHVWRQTFMHLVFYFAPSVSRQTVMHLRLGYPIQHHHDINVAMLSESVLLKHHSSQVVPCLCLSIACHSEHDG